ncbi:MAG: PIN domain-containing protein [Steroidobacteraceae bacterium]|nr:PIN domain-containing protein [Deltaproteobacteria bacterium]
MAPNRILPDTCAWIDFFRGRQTPLAEMLGDSLIRLEVVTCGVVLYELLQGLKNPGEEVLVQNALQALSHLEMTRDLWISVGRLSAQLRAAGHTLPLSDVMIAAIALENGCAVLTVDRHFEAVPGLTLLNGE